MVIKEASSTVALRSAIKRAEVRLVPEPIVFSRFLERLPEAFRRSRLYRDSQWSAELIRSVQTHRLKEILVHAISTVPGYSELGITVEDIERDPWAALKRMPFLSKADLQNRLTSYVSDALESKTAFKVSTSGSTGVPLVIVDDDDSLVEYSASYQRILANFGIELGERMANVIADAARPEFAIEAQLLAGVAEIATINLLDSASRLNPEAVVLLQRLRPSVLFGNPSDLLLLALQVAPHAIDSVDVVISCGENLLPSMREQIGERLSSRVVQIYSMQECKAIAWECSEGGVHIDEERVVVENVSNHEIVITNLCNFSMPLIRYRTADVGRVADSEESPCKCGRKLATLHDFTGRDRGFIVTPDGRWFSPRSTKLYLTRQALLGWRLVQDDPQQLRVELVPRSVEDVCQLTLDIERDVADLLDNSLRVIVKIMTLEQLFVGTGKYQMMRLTAFQTSSQGANHVQ